MFAVFFGFPSRWFSIYVRQFCQGKCFFQFMFAGFFKWISSGLRAFYLFQFVNLGGYVGVKLVFNLCSRVSFGFVRVQVVCVLDQVRKEIEKKTPFKSYYETTDLKIEFFTFITNSKQWLAFNFFHCKFFETFVMDFDSA